MKANDAIYFPSDLFDWSLIVSACVVSACYRLVAEAVARVVKTMIRDKLY